MATHVKTKVYVNEAELEHKIENLIDDTLMLRIHSLFERMMDKYVPYLNGPLSRTAEVTAKGVTYVQPYARYQYVGEDFNHTTEVHPLATAYWDKAMMTNEGEAFTKQVQMLLKQRAKELYG